jgi:hypothetical protein
MLDVLKNYDSHVVRGKTYFFRKFSNIESNFDAYTIGYLACDGGYIVNRGFPIMSVSSTEINKKFLTKVLPHMLNKNKKEKLQNYLTKYSTN